MTESRSSRPAESAGPPGIGFDWLTGGGEMGQLIRSLDWSKTPVGPVKGWPQSLKTAASLMLNSRYPMFIWWGDELTILYNDGYAPIFGMKHPAALGQPARRVWTEIWKDLAAQVDAVMDEGRASWNEEVLLFMERNGFPEEVYFTWSYSPILDETGKVGGLFCACTEETTRVLGRRRLRTLRDLGERSLTEAKTAERACRAAAATLADNPNDFPWSLMYLLDDDGRRARLCATVKLAAGTKASPAIVTIDGEEDVWNFRYVLETKQSQTVQTHDDRFGHLPQGPRADDGTKQAIALPLAKTGVQEFPAGFLVVGLNPHVPFNDDYRSFCELAAGQIATAIVNARGYEEERKRAEALAELDWAKTLFFSNVSHEFRTPLTLMLGSLEDELHDRPGTPNLEVAHRNSMRLLKLVNTLLDFSRLEAGRAQALFEPTELGAFTADLAGLFRSATERAGLRLVVDCPASSKPVYVDRGMWEKVVLNLMSNAFKFTFEGEIEVSLREGGTDNSERETQNSAPRSVALRVRDTGEGIPAEDIPRLFERFYRVENMRSRTHEGTGIGLALVHELIKLHGGSVRIESEIGKGTAVIVTVPLGTEHLPADRIGAGNFQAGAAAGPSPFTEEALRWLPNTSANDELGMMNDASQEVFASPHSSRSTQHSEVCPAARPRIVLADDNADMREYLLRLLKDRYEVTAVADGEAALAAARGRRPDLILTDVMMPRLDGFGLLRELRGDPAMQTIPIILLSARAGEEARVEGLDQGADDYLIKPFSARELLARVRSHLDMARRRREAQAEISRSKLFLERIAASTPDMLFVFDIIEGRNVYVNRSVELVMGYTAEGLRSMEQDPGDSLVHPDDLPGVKAWYASFNDAAEDKVLEHDHRIRHVDGSYRRLLVRAAVFERTSDGRAKLIIGVASDVTERKRQEEALATRSRQQRLLYDLAEAVNRAGVLADLYEKALDAIIHSLNADRASILLFDEDDVMRFKASRGLSEHYRCAVEGHSPWRRDSLSPRPMVVGDIAAAEIEDGLRSVIRREGIHALGFIPLMYGGRLLGKFMVYFNHPHTMNDEEIDLAQAIAGTLALGIERTIAEQSLRRSEERLRLAMAASCMGAWDIELANGTVTWDAKQCELYGLPGGAAVKTMDEFYAYVHPDDVARVRERAAAATASGQFYMEFRIVRPDGLVRWIVGHGATVMDGDGFATRMVGVNYDITEQKEAQSRLQSFAERLEATVQRRTEELSHSQRRLRALAAELNLAEQRERQRVATDLHDYLAQLLALSKIKLAQAKRHDMLPPVEAAVCEVQQVLDQALTYTRTLVAELSPPMLHEFGLSSALNWLVEQMKLHNLNVTLDMEASLPSILEDQARLLYQSIRELLMNVIKHGGVEQATIRVWQTERNLRIAVIDQGAGFDLAAAGTVAPQSSTFGLFSIRERMTALGGEFHLDSAPGKGTTATLSLPLMPKTAHAELGMLNAELPEASPGARSTISIRNSARHKRAAIRVLVVDDHAMVRQGLRGLLEAYADIHIIGEAANGEEAVVLAEKLEPDVVLMDINMPKIDGIEATRRIVRAVAGIGVIALSIQTAGQVEAAVKEAGAVAFINKEAAVEDLYRTIHTAVASSRSLD